MRRSDIPCRVAVVVTLLSLVAVGRVPTLAADSNPLAAMRLDAERLAKTPGGVDEAMAKYRTVIETHRANEKFYQQTEPETTRMHLPDRTTRLHQGAELSDTMNQ